MPYLFCQGAKNVYYPDYCRIDCAKYVGYSVMENIVIVVLVLIIIALGFYARILQSSLAEEERCSCRLSREKEQEELAKFKAEGDLKDFLKVLDEVLPVKATSLYDRYDKSNVDWKRVLGEAIAARRGEVFNGTREELEEVLYHLWGAVGYKDFTFEEFMHEFTTLPSAALNRIIVKISGG